MKKNILRIDASSRVKESVSRRLGDELVQAFLDHHADAALVHRDLVSHPVEHIRQLTITGFYTPEEQLDDALRDALSLSDALIAELAQADTLIITTPMYNFSVPSALKAWMDQVARIGKTFSFEAGAVTGLLPGKQALVIVTYGLSGYTQGSALNELDFVQPYIRAFLGLLGITDVTFIPVEATSVDEVAVAQQMNEARVLMRRLASY